ncbi:unnamed protein product, partial [Staurois parvus]
YWGCSQGIGLFPGNFFSALLCGFGISLASEAQSDLVLVIGRDSLVVSTVWGWLHLLPFWATSFPLWDSPWTLRRFRRFCSGLVPVVFGPFSA